MTFGFVPVSAEKGDEKYQVSLFGLERFEPGISGMNSSKKRLLSQMLGTFVHFALFISGRFLKKN
jgi:hypothetical protein